MIYKFKNTVLGVLVAKSGKITNYELGNGGEVGFLRHCDTKSNSADPQFLFT